MINCKNKKLIGPYLDGQLGECPWLDEHIAECPVCLAEYEMVQRIAYVARRGDYAPPESNYWKNFPTRVKARIAARQRPRLYSRIAGNIFGSKLLMRLTATVMIVFVSIIFIKYSDYFDRSSNSIAFNNATETELSQIDPDQAVQEFFQPDKSTNISPPAVIQPKAEIIHDIDSEFKQVQISDPVEQQKETGSDRTDLAENELTIEESFPENFQLPAAAYRSKSDIGLSSLVWTELNRAKNFDGLGSGDMNTDQVIRYQIRAGSNSNLVPLSSHREATGRYFAPERSVARDIYIQSTSPNWGYAAGSNGFDSDRLQHLKLELNLSREK